MEIHKKNNTCNRKSTRMDRKTIPKGINMNKLLEKIHTKYYKKKDKIMTYTHKKNRYNTQQDKTCNYHKCTHKAKAKGLCIEHYHIANKRLKGLTAFFNPTKPIKNAKTAIKL